MKRGLLVVAHGSERNPYSKDAVYQQTERIRGLGVFDEVGVGFWKQEPFLSQGLDTMTSNEVYVVPMFAADGYYTREVIPRELQLDGAETRRGGQTIWYCPPVGGHPEVAEIIIERARSAGAVDSTGVVVLGHGTPRNPRSGGTVYAQVEQVRERGLFAEVCAAFIDQEPNVAGVWDRTRSDDLVMVPLFMAEGWHIRETVPEDMELDAGVVTRGGRSLRITPSVGTHPRLADLIVAQTACG